MTKREEMEHLITRSEEFMETAIYQLEKGFHALAVFNSEEALKLFLKAKLLEKGVTYPRTHSVRSLMEILSDLTKTKKRDQINDFLEENLIEPGALEDAYITSRYVIREYKKREAEILFKVVKEIIENVI